MIGKYFQRLYTQNLTISTPSCVAWNYKISLDDHFPHFPWSQEPAKTTGIWHVRKKTQPNQLFSDQPEKLLYSFVEITELLTQLSSLLPSLSSFRLPFFITQMKTRKEQITHTHERERLHFLAPSSSAYDDEEEKPVGGKCTFSFVIPHLLLFWTPPQ